MDEYQCIVLIVLVLRIVLNAWIMGADARAGTTPTDRAHHEEVRGVLDGADMRTECEP